MFWGRKQPLAPQTQPALTTDELVSLNNRMIERIEVIDTLTMLDDDDKESFRERARNIVRDASTRYLTQ